MTSERADVVVVGGGPAGAITAQLLAIAGHEVILLERAPHWRWRACGVFASPASIAALQRIGFSLSELAAVARPVPAMEVVAARGTRFRLTYDGTGDIGDSAVGFDRAGLDALLLDRARAAGARIRTGVTVERLRLASDRAWVDATDVADPVDFLGRVVVGADGLRSRVAAAAGVTRRAALGPRAALTFHVPDVRANPDGHAPDARMCTFDDGYAGLAPVPGERVNVGIVLGRSWFGRLRRAGGRGVARQVLRALPIVGDRALADVEPQDRVAGVMPLGHAVARRAGASWVLVGDAAGFLDPFTGEGLHRAIVSAELAAHEIDALIRGRPGATLEAYERAMRSQFATKDLVCGIVQGFLGRPKLFEYTARRLAARTGIRETMGRVIGDLAPAGDALDPRFLASLLAP
jgi:flavin-dependent dehydrogenase